MRQVPSSVAAKLARAAELFSERGLEQVKIDDVAQATGLAKATLYYYFAGKEDMLAFLLADALRSMADAVAIALDHEGSAAERLPRVIDAQLQVMREQPAVCRALLSDLGRAGRIPEIAAAIETAYYRPVATVLQDGAKDGSLRQVDDTAEAVMAIFGAVTVAGLHYLVRDEVIPPDVAPRLASLLLRGIAEPGPREHP
jgi:TetR/AcrR family transcriptional regulator